ncbi:MAG TPA: bifunctional nuclease domain-containing protein [Streptosporangiaceae bacterium]|nr:bifunctional nuclease domain-containing protein [Streptosporangiaceae bacterium]
MDHPSAPPGYAFISYVREDSRDVDSLEGALESAGIHVWRDTANLWPGEDWREHIRNAITSNALVFIACFSTASLGRASSFQNVEITLAIEEIRNRPAAEPWIIPVRLDDCQIPDRDIGGGRTLRSIQHADLFGSNASRNLDRLVSAVLRKLGRRPAAPTFGIVTALPEEFAAMRSFMGNLQRDNVDGDRADYLLGTLPSSNPSRAHQVVLTMLGDTGNDAAASATANLLRSYRSVRCLLMVGIAAGVPDPARPERHVRLGDIVVARWGIAEYDSVQDRDDGSAPRRTFPPPSPMLERRARLLQANEAIGSRPWEDLLAAQLRALPDFSRPPASTDVLYASDDSLRQIGHPDEALSGHRPDQPKVHGGLIASGDRSLRSAAKRDEIAAAHDVLAIEMEGKGIGNAGFYDGVEWFTVRGISDYGDRHVSRLWRKYASLAAAAYTRALLAETPPLGSGRSRQDSEAAADRPGGQRGLARQVEVLGARISQSLHEPVIVLMDKRTGRFLTILANPAEAVSITYAKNGIRADQEPMRSASYVLPHDLMATVVQAVGIRLDSCEISGAANQMLVASLTFSNGRSAAARPADAIGLALRVGVPISVSAGLLEHAGTALPGEDDVPWRSGVGVPGPIAPRATRPAAFVPVPGTMPTTVAGVRAGAELDEPVAILTGKKADWSKLVRVSPVEAAAIEWALRGGAAPCPSTHLLLRDVLVTAGVQLLATIIGGCADGEVAGELMLSDGSSVEARPGDSIALALLADAAVSVRNTC